MSRHGQMESEVSEGGEGQGMSDSHLPGRAICAKVSGDGLITSSVPSRASASDSSSLSSIGSSLYDLPVMPLCVNMLFLLAASWMAVVMGCSRLLGGRSLCTLMKCPVLS